MKKTVLLCGLTALTACDATGTSGSTGGSFVRSVPDEVAQLAAPNQNLQTVKLLEEDGCYWYEHNGPVETTLLPLMSKRGRHICLQREAET